MTADLPPLFTLPKPPRKEGRGQSPAFREFIPMTTRLTRLIDFGRLLTGRYADTIDPALREDRSCTSIMVTGPKPTS